MSDPGSCDYAFVDMAMTLKDANQNVIQVPLYDVSDRAMLVLDHVNRLVDLSEIAKIVVAQDENSSLPMPKIYLKDGTQIGENDCILIDHSKPTATYSFDIE